VGLTLSLSANESRHAASFALKQGKRLANDRSFLA